MKRRAIDLSCTRSVEFRAVESESGDTGYSLRGYAAVWDQETTISGYEGNFIETISRGAFKKTLRERTPVMLFNHGRGMEIPIGVFTDVREDEQGVYVEGRLFKNDAVEPVREAIAEGAVSGMSFRMTVVRDEWRDNAGKLIKGDEIYRLLYEPGVRGPLRRTLKEVRCSEAGPVVFPAYSGTSVGLRSLEDLTDEDRETIAAEYRRTMIETEELGPDVPKLTGPVIVGAGGVGGESTMRATATNGGATGGHLDTSTAKARDDVHTDLTRWLEAEALYRWLQAENEYKTSEDRNDAAPTSTSSESGTPESNAAPKSTLHRDTRKAMSQKAPVSKNEGTRAMTLEQLRIRLAEIAVRFDEITEEHRDQALPDTEQTEWDGLEAERAKVEKSVKNIELRLERLKEQALEPGFTERTSDRSPAFHKATDIFDLDALRKESRSAEDLRDKMRQNASRAIEKARFSRVTSQEKAQERAQELLDTYDDENGTLAERILVTGSPLYERAFSKALKACSTAGLSTEEQRAMALGTDSAGGFAVPVQLDPTVILTNDGHIGDLRRLARVETIVGKEWQGITSTGIAVSRDGTPTTNEIGRVAEATEASDGSFVLAQPTLRVVRVQGFVPFSIEVEQDWGGLRSEITRMLADAKGREENESFVLGDATGTQPGGVVGSLPAGSKVAPTTVETFAVTDLYKVKNALAPRWRANAQWLAAADTYDKIRGFDTAGGANFWTNLNNGTPEKLIGYQINENSYVDSTWDVAATAANNLVLLFGDFSQFLILDRIGMSVELVPHLMGSAGRPNGQRGVYATWRNNSKVLVPEAFKVLNIATTA